MAEVRNNTAGSRYEIHLDGELVGFADYRIEGDIVVFPHTEVRSDLQGRGLGAELVRGALEDVRGSGRRIRPYCWYVLEFVHEHPEYRGLLTA